jgi:hypothetical protein
VFSPHHTYFTAVFNCQHPLLTVSNTSTRFLALRHVCCPLLPILHHFSTFSFVFHLSTYFLLLSLVIFMNKHSFPVTTIYIQQLSHVFKPFNRFFNSFSPHFSTFYTRFDAFSTTVNCHRALPHTQTYPQPLSTIFPPHHSQFWSFSTTFSYFQPFLIIFDHFQQFLIRFQSLSMCPNVPPSTVYWSCTSPLFFTVFAHLFYFIFYFKVLYFQLSNFS